MFFYREKSAEVFLPEDWYKIVREANLRKPFEVTEMEQKKFLDWKSHLEQKYKLNKKNISGKAWRLREVHWLNFGWGEEIDEATGQTVLRHHPGEVWMRKGLFKTEPWTKIKMHTRENNNTTLVQLYNDNIRLKDGKVNDLKAMARKYILAPQKEFYLYLQASDGEDNGEGKYQ